VGGELAWSRQLNQVSGGRIKEVRPYQIVDKPAWIRRLKGRVRSAVNSLAEEHARNPWTARHSLLFSTRRELLQICGSSRSLVPRHPADDRRASLCGKDVADGDRARKNQ
jgi:hypothetical protein